MSDPSEKRRGGGYTASAKRREPEGRAGCCRLRWLGGLTPVEVAIATLRAFRRENLDARSAQFAYYSMQALAPLLIVALAAVAQLPIDGVLQSLLEGADNAIPRGAQDVIVAQVQDVQERSSTSLVLVALMILGYAGMKLFVTVSRGLNAAYGVEEQRRSWQVYGLALLLTLGAMLLLLLALVLLVVGPLLSRWLVDLVELPDSPLLSVLMHRGVRWAVVVSAVLLASSLIYWLAPNVKHRWSPWAPDSLFATVGWVVLSLGFGYYVDNFGRYNQTYGALGGVIVITVWLHLCGAVLLMGGQIGGVIHRASTGAPLASRGTS